MKMNNVIFLISSMAVFININGKGKTVQIPKSEVYSRCLKECTSYKQKHDVCHKICDERAYGKGQPTSQIPIVD